MGNPDYMKEFHNALKNTPRLYVMKAVLGGPCSLSQLQQGLRKLGYNYRPELLSEECLRPLITVGLAASLRDSYYATTLGSRLMHLLQGFQEFADKLPTHSECYEEALLKSLLSGPKTFKDIEAEVGPKNVSRTLRRLHTSGLMTTPKARAYIFFFKTIRDPNKETLTATERKVYDAIASEGICAVKLAKKTGLSIRRTYKCLRRLKGKKLVFLRRTPKTYALTCKGKKLALILQKLQQAVEDMWVSSQGVMRDNQSILEAGGLSSSVLLR
jgi:DNA-binding HxlR family transcriptional regulator